MSIGQVGRTESFDFEVQDDFDRSWDCIMTMAEKKAQAFVDELNEKHQVDHFSFKFETVVSEYGCNGFVRTYKFLLEAKVWSKLE